MGDFVNTIDLWGDAAVTDALISRTIAEYNDDMISELPSNAFRGNSELLKVRLPSVSKYNAYNSGWRFQDCQKLQIADLGLIPAIGYADFMNCTNLVAVVFRKNAVIFYGGAFSGTPIESGNGYIYVPRAMVDSYKAATNWSTYASQFRALEDYTVDGTVDGELDESKI